MFDVKLKWALKIIRKCKWKLILSSRIDSSEINRVQACRIKARRKYSHNKAQNIRLNASFSSSYVSYSVG